jgi:hypothetical protein
MEFSSQIHGPTALLPEQKPAPLNRKLGGHRDRSRPCFKRYLAPTGIRTPNRLALSRHYNEDTRRFVENNQSDDFEIIFLKLLYITRVNVFGTNRLLSWNYSFWFQCRRFLYSKTLWKFVRYLKVFVYCHMFSAIYEIRRMKIKIVNFWKQRLSASLKEYRKAFENRESKRQRRITNNPLRHGQRRSKRRMKKQRESDKGQVIYIYIYTHTHNE